MSEPRRLKCEKCESWLKLPDQAAGKIRCPRCQAVLPIPEHPPAGEEELEEVEEPRPSPRASSPRRPRSRDDEDDRPSRASRRRDRDEDDEDRPRRRSRRDDDDDPTDRPVRRLRSSRDDEDEVPEEVLARGQELSVPLKSLAQPLRDAVREHVKGREEVVYVGQPDPKVKLITAAPAGCFGVIFAGVACVFVAVGLAQGFWPFALIGGLFVLVGGLITLSPLFSYLLTSRTCYVLTTRRCLVIDNRLLFGVNVTVYNRHVVERMRRMDSWFVGGAGDLVMREEIHVTHRTGRHGGTSVNVVRYGFIAIREVAAVEELITEVLLG